MRKSFMARVAPLMVVALCAIFGFMMPGCEQYADIIQNAQNPTPVAADFTIIGLTATADGSPKTVSIKPKTGKSPGDITVYYEGTNGTVYPKNVKAPSAVGKYAVTFDVEEADGFNAAKGLKAGTLTISVKTSAGGESEDDEYEDDNYSDENPNEDDVNHEDLTEETAEPLSLIDFEDKAWAGSGANSFTNRKVRFKGHVWSVSGRTTMDNKDHYIGSRGIRLRGNTKDDAGNVNRLELESFLTDGIESISFDYASYSSHSGGTIILYYQKEDEDWEEVGKVTNIPSWTDVGEQMLNAKFEVNVTGNVRFKIEKVTVSSNKATVNIDNIVITYLQ